jgi:hypothetical protein
MIMTRKHVTDGGVIKSTECGIGYLSGGCSRDLETLQCLSVSETDEWCTVLG